MSRDRRPAAERTPGLAELNRLAQDFWGELRAEGIDAPRSFAIMSKILSYAGATEQRLAEQAERLAMLEALSVTDELTTLLNRRGFNDALVRTLANAKRHREHGLLAYIDLDEFKYVNDTYGHAAGDHLLKNVAALLKDKIRSTDFAARLGGDEFAVLFVRADTHALRHSMGRLRTALNTASVLFNGVRLPMRASVGVVSYGPGAEASDLMMRADRAMYREKKARQQELEEAIARQTA